MKKITFLAALLVASLSYGQDNLVADSDFELINPSTLCNEGVDDAWFSNAFGNSNISKLGDPGSQYLLLDNFTATGPKCFESGGAGSSKAAQLKQYITFDDTQHTAVSGDYFVVSLDVKKHNDNDAVFSIRIKEDDTEINSASHELTAVTGGEIVSSQFRVDTESLTTTEWKTVSFYFQILDLAKETQIFLSLAKNGTDNGGVLIDNWTMKYVADPSSLSVRDFLVFNFSYGPNPAENILKLSAQKNITKIEFYNLLGQKALSTKVNAMQKEINISSLQKGVYFMEVTIGDDRGTYKIIKN